MPGYDLDAIRAYIDHQLPAGLADHCKRTAARARALAEHHTLDANKAEAAGLLHDCLKPQSREEIDQAVRDIGFGTLEFKGMPDPVVHGPAAALVVEQELDISDKEVLEAISVHSTGDAHMGDIAKIVFLADYTETGRDLPGIEEDRAACLGDLNHAVLHVLSRKLAYLIQHQLPIDRRAWETYNAFAERLHPHG